MISFDFRITDSHYSKRLSWATFLIKPSDRRGWQPSLMLCASNFYLLVLVYFCWCVNVLRWFHLNSVFIILMPPQFINLTPSQSTPPLYNSYYTSLALRLLRPRPTSSSIFKFYNLSYIHNDTKLIWLQDTKLRIHRLGYVGVV